MNSGEVSFDKESLVIVSFSISLTIEAPAVNSIIIIARTSIEGMYKSNSSRLKSDISALLKYRCIRYTKKGAKTIARIRIFQSRRFSLKVFIKQEINFIRVSSYQSD